MFRAIAAVFTALGVMVLSASCIDLLDLNDHTGATEQLCATLESCFGPDYYPSCRAWSDPRLTNAESAARSAWLNAFVDSGCLETCEAARACLDEAPVCGASAEACAQREQCCGFTDGSTDCAAGACCTADGNTCGSDADCCNNDCTAPVGETTTFCGGYACTKPGEACLDNFECCTDVCIAGVCSDSTCLPPGSDCSFNAECCFGTCSFEGVDLGGDVDPVGHCIAQGCNSDGEPCADPAECCSTFCVASSLGGAFCNSNECLPAGAPCEAPSGECCGRCDPVKHQCVKPCAGPLEPCDADTLCCDGGCPASGSCECRQDGDPCGQPADCCNNNCMAGNCGGAMCPEVGTPCEAGSDTCCAECGTDEQLADGMTVCCDVASCDHKVCQIGSPLKRGCPCDSCSALNNPVVPPDQCVAAICDSFPHCCCTAWDDVCTAAAKSLCGAICVADPVPM